GGLPCQHERLTTFWTASSSRRERMLGQLHLNFTVPSQAPIALHVIARETRFRAPGPTFFAIRGLESAGRSEGSAQTLLVSMPNGNAGEHAIALTLLPSNSPDHNPVRYTFSQARQALRRIEA